MGLPWWVVMFFFAWSFGLYSLANKLGWYRGFQDGYRVYPNVHPDPEPIPPDWEEEGWL